jgi:hypothetical protein
MIRAFSLSLACCALPLSGCGADSPATIGEAHNAYSQIRVGEAEAAFARIAADPAASAADRAQALRANARIAWLIDGDAARALQGLAAADRIGEDRCGTAQLRARVLDESGGDEALLREADALAGRCDDPAEAAGVRLHAASAALDRAALDRAAALIAALGEDARSGLRGADLGLELALRRDDAAGALAAWRNYFWLGADDLPPALRGQTRPAALLFGEGLAPGATVEQRLALLDLLMRAGFLRQAQRFADAKALAAAAAGQPVWTRFAAYSEARRGLEAAILQSNRRVARGGAAADLDGAVERFLVRLVAASGLEGERRQLLRRAYGLYGQAGQTGGYASVHYGHVVQDERRTVEQYGHRADVGFVAVDNMIANGFETWLWDGRAATGGWTEPGLVIVQVRPEYTSQPLSAWDLWRGGPARQRLLDRQGERAAADAAALAEGGIGFLPGLADRLRLQLAGQIGARARQLAAGGGDLRRIFLDEYWRATFQQSMFAHEGRHAIDRSLVTGLTRFDDSNLEYRAKLSEIALAHFPRLALLNINDPTVGGDTGHGIANARVLRGFGAWIEANRARVRGFDPAAPLIAQIDRLSDGQIRAVARSLDPILR